MPKPAIFSGSARPRWRTRQIAQTRIEHEHPRTNDRHAERGSQQESTQRRPRSSQWLAQREQCPKSRKGELNDFHGQINRLLYPVEYRPASTK